MKIAIIGAGIAGLSAARALTIDGADVTLFDRAKSVGGRAATRRIGSSQFDHGAQYLSLTSQGFGRVVDQWLDAGWIDRWRPRVAKSDGQLLFSVQHTKNALYVPIPSMNSLPKHLSEALAIELDYNVHSLLMTASGWTVIGEREHGRGVFNAVVVAAHPIRARALVADSAPLTAALGKAEMLPVWATMVDVSEPLGLAADFITFEYSVLDVAICDSSKPGRPTGERWVLHTNSDYAKLHYDTPKEVVASEMLGAFSRLVGRHMPPAIAVAHRWGNAIPSVVHRDKAHWDNDLQLGLCGDWCNGISIEAAYLSGQAIAKMIRG